MIAARWFGWGAVVVIAAGVIVVGIGSRGRTSAQRSDESWRELTYRTYSLGMCATSPERRAFERAADEEAVAACMDEWRGNVAIHPHPSPETTEVMVEETSELARCIETRYDGGRFCHGGFGRPPADAAFHIPQHSPKARSRSFDEFAYWRSIGEEAVASGEYLSISCPATPVSTFVGLPTRDLRRAMQMCKRHDVHGQFVLAVDEAGNVARVIVKPEQLGDVPCAIANSCGLQFAGLGAILYF